jgi:hypothetical protein
MRRHGDRRLKGETRKLAAATGEEVRRVLSK